MCFPIEYDPAYFSIHFGHYIFWYTVSLTTRVSLAEVFHPWVFWEGPGSGFENCPALAPAATGHLGFFKANLLLEVIMVLLIFQFGHGYQGMNGKI